MHPVWTRATRGEHSVVVGLPPTDPTDRRVVVRIDCEGPWSTFGPLEDARRRIEQLLGNPPPDRDETTDARGSGVLTRFLGDIEEPTVEASLVAAANRLALHTDGAAVLVFESVEHADAPTIQGLMHILARPGWLTLPMVLHVLERTAAGPVAELLTVVQKVAGAGAVVDIARSTDATLPPAEALFDWRALPPEVLRVLRAASVVGRAFESDLVASLLDESPTHVLELLQRAVDEGAPIADRGRGRFYLPPGSPVALQARLLPSLLEHYNRRLAELLSPAARPHAERIGGVTIPPPTQVSGPTTDPSVAYADLFEDPPPPPRPAARGASPSSRPTENIPIVAPERPTVRIDPAPSRRRSATEPPRGRAVDRDTQPPTSVPTNPRARRPNALSSDDARAAKHFSAAGDPEAAVSRYVEAIRKVASGGDSGRALLLADEAHALLEQLPGSPRRAILRARILAEAGRVQWRGAGLGPALTLPGALETLEAALAALRGDAPRDLRTELASLIAGVCYDLGDTRSLERALGELTAASEAHLQAGQTEKAARLLNDQAAVYLRAGDPVRATHLLDRSREIFDSLHRVRPDDPIVIRERAETEHLLARLPLHARLREGREDDAHMLALGHARAAAEGYERLGSPRDAARVWETMGRLEIQGARLEQASAHLLRALEVQRSAGDAVGLARTTAALSELYLADGEAGEGIAVLGDSIALNFEKGSPIGLAYNRRALARLRPALEDPAATAALSIIESKLEQAENALGRVALPSSEPG